MYHSFYWGGLELRLRTGRERERGEREREARERGSILVSLYAGKRPRTGQERERREREREHFSLSIRGGKAEDWAREGRRGWARGGAGHGEVLDKAVPTAGADRAKNVSGMRWAGRGRVPCKKSIEVQDRAMLPPG